MFIRRKYVNGKRYLYLVESVRLGNRVSQKIIGYLGPEAMGVGGLRRKLEELKGSGVVKSGDEPEIPGDLFHEIHTIIKAKQPLERALPVALVNEIYNILKILKSEKVDFLICGMSTVNAYLGNIRASQDLDLFIPTKQTFGKIKLALNRQGYNVKPKRLAQFIPVFSKRHPELPVSIVDILPAGAFNMSLDERSFERAVRVKFKNMSLKGASIEEILLTKMSRNDERDAVDAKLILIGMKDKGQEPDFDYIRERASEWGKESASRHIEKIWKETN